MKRDKRDREKRDRVKREREKRDGAKEERVKREREGMRERVASGRRRRRCSRGSNSSL